MALIIIFLACFLLYSKSKHAPTYLENIKPKLFKNKKSNRLFAYLLFLTSVFILNQQFDLATAILVFFIALMFGLCITIFSLPLNRRIAYILSGLSVVVIIMENII